MVKKIILLSAALAAAIFLFWNNLGAPADAGGGGKKFSVSEGEPAARIADNLRKENLIRSAWYFKYLVKSRSLNIQAGEYVLSPKLSAGEIAELMSAGRVVSREKSITIIEGWNSKDMAAYLEKGGYVKAAEFDELARSSAGDWKLNFARPDFLGDAPEAAGLEGYLFPDTYRIFEGAPAGNIINKMLDNFNKKLTVEMRAEIKRQNKTIYEIVTMASLLEKEVRTAEDMKIVSGIFWNRIKYGMPLQSDAALSYIYEDKIGGHTIKQTKVDSPYNTYKYRGLPPGPIASPGLNAITAAIYPGYTEYVYFLSEQRTGQTIFSRTFDEHKKNKDRYLK